MPCDCEVQLEFEASVYFKVHGDCRREKPVLGSKKDIDNLDQVQWRATKMVREHEHLSVRRQECWGWPSLEEAPGNLSSNLPYQWSSSG